MSKRRKRRLYSLPAVKRNRRTSSSYDMRRVFHCTNPECSRTFVAWWSQLCRYCAAIERFRLGNIPTWQPRWGTDRAKPIPPRLYNQRRGKPLRPRIR